MFVVSFHVQEADSDLTSFQILPAKTWRLAGGLSRRHLQDDEAVRGRSSEVHGAGNGETPPVLHPGRINGWLIV